MTPQFLLAGYRTWCVSFAFLLRPMKSWRYFATTNTCFWTGSDSDDDGPPKKKMTVAREGSCSATAQCECWSCLVLQRNDEEDRQLLDDEEGHASFWRALALQLGPSVLQLRLRWVTEQSEMLACSLIKLAATQVPTMKLA